MGLGEISIKIHSLPQKASTSGAKRSRRLALLEQMAAPISSPLSNIAVQAAPSGRWTLRDKATGGAALTTMLSGLLLGLPSSFESAKRLLLGPSLEDLLRQGNEF